MVFFWPLISSNISLTFELWFYLSQTPFHCYRMGVCFGPYQFLSLWNFELEHVIHAVDVAVTTLSPTNFYIINLTGSLNDLKFKVFQLIWKSQRIRDSYTFCIIILCISQFFVCVCVCLSLVQGQFAQIEKRTPKIVLHVHWSKQKIKSVNFSICYRTPKLYRHRCLLFSFFCFPLDFFKSHSITWVGSHNFNHCLCIFLSLQMSVSFQWPHAAAAAATTASSVNQCHAERLKRANNF